MKMKSSIIERGLSVLRFVVGTSLAVCCTRAGTYAEVHESAEAIVHCDSISGRIRLECEGLLVRSPSPDESLFYDANLYVFGDYDIPEFRCYQLFRDSGSSLDCNLVLGRSYKAYVVVNAGYDLGYRSVSELEEMKYWLSRPDDCRRGIVMSGECSFTAQESCSPTVKTRRLMSKVGIRIDRSRLDDDVDFHVSSAKICNSPKWAGLFKSLSVTSADDMFASGFTKSDEELAALNTADDNGLSGEIPLYMLENRRESFSSQLCSYIEIRIDYLSDECHSEGQGLVYRHRLRSSDSYDIVRNGWYHVTVRPESSGLLCEDSWRVDKSEIVWDSSDPSLQIYPSGSTVDGTFYEHYYTTVPGDSLKFRLIRHPSSMSIWLDEELVQDDLEYGKGIWSLDKAGKELTFKATGRGMAAAEIYAGPPLNDSETIIVEIM